MVSYEYMRIVANNNRYKMNYLHGRRNFTEYEIDFIIHDDSAAYVFDCKLNDNENAVISDKASIVKDVIVDILGSKDIDVLGRYIIYQAGEKAYKANGRDVIFTSNWDTDFTAFNRQLKDLREVSQEMEEDMDYN